MPSEAHSETQRPSYFLLSVSTRKNLELCIRYGLAGFPGGESGAWTFCEIEKGDYVSFLYGARAYNLYKVTSSEAYRNADRLPPWEPLVFDESQKTYYFPFRLHLQPMRSFAESIVRAEFSYVAENLLLRGGYRKTHFQADQTTLQSVSEMGTRADGSAETLPMPEHTTYDLRFTRTPELVKTPEICRFKEPILQASIRRHLMSVDNLKMLLANLNQPVDGVDGLEILGEKAIPLGHIDLLLKQRIPLGSAWKIPIEVKAQRAQPDDLSQLREYMDELQDDCRLGLLIAADFAKRVEDEAAGMAIRLVRYNLDSDLKQTPTFEEIWRGLTLEPLKT
jgi:hypothetical protein